MSLFALGPLRSKAIEALVKNKKDKGRAPEQKENNHEALILPDEVIEIYF